MKISKIILSINGERILSLKKNQKLIKLKWLKILLSVKIKLVKCSWILILNLYGLVQIYNFVKLIHPVRIFRLLYAFKWY